MNFIHIIHIHSHSYYSIILFKNKIIILFGINSGDMQGTVMSLCCLCGTVLFSTEAILRNITGCPFSLNKTLCEISMIISSWSTPQAVTHHKVFLLHSQCTFSPAYPLHSYINCGVVTILQTCSGIHHHWLSARWEVGNRVGSHLLQ